MARLSQRITATVDAAALAASSWARGPTETPLAATWPMGPEWRERLSVRWPAAYEWPPAAKWVEWLRGGLAGRVDVTTTDIPQQYEGVVLIEVDLDGHRHEVAIDYFDRERVLDEVVERCGLVFKMQYRRGGYGHDHVIPGGYVPAHSTLFRYLPALRAIRARGRRRFDLYGRFGSSYATGAIGCCVVRPAPSTRLHVPLQDNAHIRYCREDMSDLVDVCGELVADPASCTRIGNGAREYFDRYLHPDQLTGYYLERCATVLDGT